MAESSDNSLFREIDEELRQEHYAKLWKKYGNVLIAAAIMLVVGVAGYQGWRSYDINNRQAEGENFAAAITQAQNGQNEAAQTALTDIAANAGAGYAMLARFQKAALVADEGDFDGAAAIYFGIATDGATEEAFQGLATVLGVAQALNGKADAASLESRLSPLLSESNPWRFSARELNAVLALKSGKTKEAQEMFSALAKAPLAPQGIKARAGELTQMLAQ